MNLSAGCMHCLIEKQWERIQDHTDEQAKAAYMKDVLREVASAGDGDSAPVVVARLSRLHRAYFGNPYSFDDIKAEYNARLLGLEAEIRLRICSAADPLEAALKFARAGNYIDFGAMGRVDEEKLSQLIDGTADETLDAEVYARFTGDLQKARSLAYITDNCGEIVLDKLLIETLLTQYPRLQITAIVRGVPVLNDATLDDAFAVGLPDVCEVLGNGTDIAGTQLGVLCQEAKARIDEADVIVSKGQGNFETLHGCRLNVYYLFLCKCGWFTKRFGLKLHEGVFVDEGNVRFLNA